MIILEIAFISCSHLAKYPKAVCSPSFLSGIGSCWVEPVPCFCSSYSEGKEEKFFIFLIKQLRIRMGERLNDIRILTAWGRFSFTAVPLLNTEESVVKLFCRELCLNSIVSTWMLRPLSLSCIVRCIWKCIKAVMFFTSTHPFLLFRKVSVNISVTLTAVVYGLSNCLFLLWLQILEHLLLLIRLRKAPSVSLNLGFKHGKHLWWDKLEYKLQPASCSVVAVRVLALLHFSCGDKVFMLL